MIQAVSNTLREAFSGCERIGILSTLGTYKSETYSKYLAFNKFLPVVLTEDLQREIHEAIYNPEYGIKSGRSLDPDKVFLILDRSINHLIAQGAQVIILGCTELELFFSQRQYTKASLIYPSDILARKLIDFSAPQRLRPWKMMWHGVS